MKTNIPPTEYTQIRQTNSSPETIASLLNEREEWYLRKRGLWRRSQKYPYPFWKVCTVCQTVYPAVTQAQAKKNKTCSPDCAKTLFEGRPAGSGKPPEELDGMVQIECAVCGKKAWKERSQLKKIASPPTCSNQCRGKMRGAEAKVRWEKNPSSRLLHHWTEEEKQAAREEMTGAKNPAWKGGVTYRKRKGNYANQSIKYVRCPEAFLPMARKDGYVTEHRLLVAQALGRCLSRQEAVHHFNHNAEDNRMENLALFASNKDHKLYEHHGKPEPLWRG